MKKRVYDQQLMDERSNILKEEYITGAISEYLKQGITISYKNSTSLSWRKRLVSNLHTSLRDFQADLNLSDEKTKHLLEALMLNVLERFSFVGNGLLSGKEADMGIKQEKAPGKEKTESLLPVKLKDKDEKEISIFSNEVENYLAEGAIYRFLKCLSGIFLKERGVEISKAEWENVSKEILFKIVANKMPREEDKIVRYLPELISEIGSKFTGQIKYRGEVMQPAL